MVRLEERHFHVTDMTGARELRRRLAELGAAVTAAGRGTRAATWTRGHYVTRKQRADEHWVAWLKSDLPGIHEEILTALAHPHLVLPQDGEDAWLGVNVEFKSPRDALRVALLEQRAALAHAVRQLPAAEVWLVVKSVFPGEHQSYYWENDDWPGWSYPASAAFTDEGAASVLAVLENVAGRPESPREGYAVEPAVVFAWQLAPHQLVAWGDDLPAELVRRVETAAPLLSLLAGD